MPWIPHLIVLALMSVQMSLPLPLPLSQDTGKAATPAETTTTLPQARAAVNATDEDDVDDKVIALLDALERDHADLRGFTAKVRYDKETLVGRETRLGEVVYIADLEPAGDDQQSPQYTSRRFAILFDTFVDGRRKRTRLEHYVFDGRWLAEINHADKQFIKREIVPPGETLDPLKLGEGPFPMPIGQTRADVLERFVAVPATLPQSGPLAKLNASTVDGLQLTPREGTPEAEEFRQVVIFYDRATRLPVGVITEEPNGDRRVVRLTDVQRDPELTDELRRKVSIETPPANEWRIDIQGWQSAG